MSELLKRLLRIAKAYFPKIRQFEFTSDNEFKTDYSKDTAGDHHSTFNSNTKADTAYSDLPQQILEDLANFNLNPPSSLEEVRKARNREIKKYHPDRHMNDPEKRRTAKEILQIYNASYERLKVFYEKKG